MLCVANVHLPDWGMNEARDVDPEDEAIRGLLRAGFIVPLVRAHRADRYDGIDGGGAEAGRMIEQAMREQQAMKERAVPAAEEAEPEKPAPKVKRGRASGGT